MYPDYTSKAYQHLCAALDSHKQGSLIFITIYNHAAISVCYDAAQRTQLYHDLHTIATSPPAVSACFHIHAHCLAVIATTDNADIIQQLDTAICHYAGIDDAHPIHIQTNISSICFPNDQCSSAIELIDAAYIAADATQPPTACTADHYVDLISWKQHLADEMHKLCFLKHAAAQSRIKLAFQPIIASQDGHTFCYEALLRIVTPDNQLISAGPYISLAESCGYIAFIDRMVFDMVIEELKLDDSVVLSFNISSHTINNDAWLAHVKHILTASPELAPRLIFEITETSVHHDIWKATHFVVALQSLGSKVALDDVGAGYTSFRQLSTLPVDIVKIDGAFIKTMLDSHESHMFVRSLLDFTRSYGFKTVAEFVETGEVTKELMELNVDYLQGYYFGKPTHYRPWVR